MNQNITLLSNSKERLETEKKQLEKTISDVTQERDQLINESKKMEQRLQDQEASAIQNTANQEKQIEYLNEELNVKKSRKKHFKEKSNAYAEMFKSHTEMFNMLTDSNERIKNEVEEKDKLEKSMESLELKVTEQAAEIDRLKRNQQAQATTPLYNYNTAYYQPASYYSYPPYSQNAYHP